VFFDYTGVLRWIIISAIIGIATSDIMR